VPRPRRDQENGDLGWGEMIVTHTRVFEDESRPQLRRQHASRHDPHGAPVPRSIAGHRHADDLHAARERGEKAEAGPNFVPCRALPYETGLLAAEVKAVDMYHDARHVSAMLHGVCRLLQNGGVRSREHVLRPKDERRRSD
jgi:hypothetical protein